MQTPIEKATETNSQHNIELRCLLLRLIDPDDLGHAVSNEVRAEIVRVLNTSKTNRGELQ